MEDSKSWNFLGGGLIFCGLFSCFVLEGIFHIRIEVAIIPFPVLGLIGAWIACFKGTGFGFLD